MQIVFDLHYGKDIPYELIFKPLNSQAFQEAKVSWETAAEQNYKDLPAPEFPADAQNWQTLRHLRTRTGYEIDALDRIEKIFQRRVVIDLDSVESHSGFKNLAVKIPVNDEPAIIMLPKDLFDKSTCRIWSVEVMRNMNERRKTFLSAHDWRISSRNGVRFAVKTIDGTEVAFFENAFLFVDDVNFSADMRVSFELNDKGGRARAINILADDIDIKFYWADQKRIAEGNLPYDWQKLRGAFFPLYMVYANGRSVKTPGCPVAFGNCVKRLAATLLEDTLQAIKAGNFELYTRLIRAMCIMSADMGEKLYDFFKLALEKNPKLLDEVLGCALGDYDRPEQQKLLLQIHGSTMKMLKKFFVLNKAAWNSDGFTLNAPPMILMPYFQSAIDFLKKRNPKNALAVLKCLEFIISMFRLRKKGDDALNKSLSLNNGKVRELYVTLEDMIDEDYKLPPSRLELKVSRKTDYTKKIPDLYYALLFYINGGEDEIKISGIKNDADDEN